MKGKHREPKCRPRGCSPGLFIPNPLLSVLLAETRKGWTIASTSLDSCLTSGQPATAAKMLAPGGPSFLHQRGVY